MTYNAKERDKVFDTTVSSLFKLFTMIQTCTQIQNVREDRTGGCAKENATNKTKQGLTITQV